MSTTEIPAAPGQARGDQGGQSRGDPRRGACRVRQQGYGAASRPRHRAADGSAHRARSTTTSPTRRRSCAPCWWRPPPRCGPGCARCAPRRATCGSSCRSACACSAFSFLGGGPRDVPAPCGATPGPSAPSLGGTGAGRRPGGEPISDLRDGIGRGALPPMDVDYAAAAMFGAGLRGGDAHARPRPPGRGPGDGLRDRALRGGGLPAAV